MRNSRIITYLVNFSIFHACKRRCSTTIIQWYRHTQFRAAHKHSKLNRLVTGRTYNVQCSTFKAEVISHYCTTDNTPWRYSEHTHARTHARTQPCRHTHTRMHTHLSIEVASPNAASGGGSTLAWMCCKFSRSCSGCTTEPGRGGEVWMGGGREREGGDGCKSELPYMYTIHASCVCIQ